MPFALFRAPLKHASDFRSRGICRFCGIKSSPVFEVRAGHEVIVPCPHCSREAALDADDRAGASCSHCAAPIAFPFPAGKVFACSGCLGAGKVAIAKDTELGMVRWIDAQEGWTHGSPGRPAGEWETSPPADTGWVRVRVPTEHLRALVHMPTYPSLQGERWLFCCREPMAFLGAWTRDRFSREAPDGDGRRLFDAIVERVVPGLWEDDLHDLTGVYVFECDRCAKRRAYWDIA